MPNRQAFIKYGRFDTISNAKNGLKGSSADKIAAARVKLYKLHEKQKKLIKNGDL